MQRNEQLHLLETEQFDLCIIGGGASGAGCALDATLRGLKVALIEKTDFAAETSSKSTKLIHGGVRYLEQAFKNFDFAQLKQVRHGLEERHILLTNAPHLARPLGLITPVFSWIEGLYFTIGLKIYGLFASGKDTLPKSQWLSKAAVLRRMPTLSKKMHSAVLYYDGQLDDARYCLALVQSAQEAGCTVANHVEVVDFQKDASQKINSATLRNRLNDKSITVKAKVFLNCTGAHADHIRLMANPAESPRIRPSKGVHLMLPFEVLNSHDAMLIPKTPDGRVVFAIPYEHQMMLGTTDTPYNDLDQEPILDGQEVDFLLETLEPYLAQKVDRSLVKSGFGGLRPLIAARPGEETKTLVRDHEVEHDGTSNLFSLLGGKWTTYRLMAQDAVDAVCKYLGNAAICSTEQHILAGGEGYAESIRTKLQSDYGLSADICQHLMEKYGSRAFQVAERTKADPALATRLDRKYPYIQAEIVHAAEVEMACTIRDFLARRLRLEILDWPTAIDVTPVVAAHMGQVLGWTDEQRNTAVTEYVALVQSFQAQIR